MYYLLSYLQLLKVKATVPSFLLCHLFASRPLVVLPFLPFFSFSLASSFSYCLLDCFG